MGGSKRAFLATAEETLTPPATLPETQHIASITSTAGKNLYHVLYPNGETTLVEMPAKFRSKIWVKRGTYVVVDTAALGERENKLGGSIANIVRDERAWRKMNYWPTAFGKRAALDDFDDEDDEKSNVGKMPPSESEEDEDEETGTEQSKH